MNIIVSHDNCVTERAICVTVTVFVCDGEKKGTLSALVLYCVSHGTVRCSADTCENEVC
jgi:hypothetical protein